MNKLSKNQNGFALLELLLIVLIFAVISFGGYYVWHSQHDTKTTAAATTSANTSSTTPAIALKKFQDKDLKFQIAYPTTWTAKFDTTPTVDSGTSYPAINGSITSPSGNVLIIKESTFGGGGGGNCEPATTDVPFAAGNQCPTKEYLSIEKVQSSFNNDIYVTHTKYIGYPQSGIQYNVCLDFGLTKYSSLPTVNTPTMGISLPCNYGFGVGFDIHMTVSTENDFSSTNVHAAENIMKSFQSF